MPKRKSAVKLLKVEISEETLLKLQICKFTGPSEQLPVSSDTAKLAATVSAMHTKLMPVIEVSEKKVKMNRKDKLLQIA